jgi:hypothetical protein
MFRNYLAFFRKHLNGHAIMRPEWPHGKMTDGRGDLIQVIHLNLGAEAFEAMNDHARYQCSMWRSTN